MLKFRNKLTDWCDKHVCDECLLRGEICRCGRGSHFLLMNKNGKYDMSDEEIIDAYQIAFNIDLTIHYDISLDDLMDFLS